MPPDFAEMFVRLGWEEIEEHYATGQRVVRRWLRQVGEADLIQRRRAYVRKFYAAMGQSNVRGRKPKLGTPEMRGDDPALAYMPIRRLRRPYRPRPSTAWQGCLRHLGQ
jgi:hypothetical protein